MTLPGNVSIKFGTYLLFCRQLLDHLPALEQAVVADADEEVAGEKYLERFNEHLIQFLKGRDHATLLDAATSFGGLLDNGIDVLVGRGHKVRQVFRDLIANALAKATDWDLEAEINHHHTHGRDLARRFFSQCLSLGVPERLDRQAEVVLEYGGSQTAGESPNMNLSLGYRVAPIATYNIKTTDGVKPKIVLRVAYDNDFNLYLCYPFLFLHEYTSHIFANDSENALFNDGWMLFAADDFLKFDWFAAVGGTHPLKHRQVAVFREYFYENLGTICRRGFQTAFMLSSWFSQNSSTMSFQSMTCELAGFEPSASEHRFWPTKFINALRAELEENSSGFRAKMEASNDIRSLYTTLPHS